MDVLFQEFSQHGVLAFEFGFQFFDLLLLGRFDGLGRPAVVEGGVVVLEELLEPGVKLVGADVVLIAEVGNGDLLEGMPVEDGNLFGAGKVTALFGHDE